jgi:hypothetical protein
MICRVASQCVILQYYHSLEYILVASNGRTMEAETYLAGRGRGLIELLSRVLLTEENHDKPQSG